MGFFVDNLMIFRITDTELPVKKSFTADENGFAINYKKTINDKQQTINYKKIMDARKKFHAWRFLLSQQKTSVFLDKTLGNSVVSSAI